MTNAERRSQIQSVLSTSLSPISASKLARRFHVSRQTIVGDVSLLRAGGEGIVATVRGYEYQYNAVHEVVLVCRHTPIGSADEMQRIIKAGGVIEDVVVDHPLCGQIRANLQVRDKADVNLFMAKIKQQKAHLLSELTDGVHTHTIAYDTPEQLVAIQASLREAGYLYEDGPNT
ncbi:transcription repressor NadR [Lactobacillus sp. LC28-10]|uniref:Transcription repressor NadR n=1 Tax=Secundilactobacillus angelensis TaxID=2722706 RepID=A0ABX1L0R5_9LACO|nr:transcription repressor NadR [Secundilactobacillus angelensis]MCH5462623.1 transcription repressor NadR [Secundilactobacillus angelensis]NLR19115.1 transcription repressor NadR [Secundilactobacillus angelensis]